ncbi:AraC family transcriptional regulator [Paenibacillus sp. XY044]|uniref:AraC family transcriptional regulator n=1 Tax=Paenibacillus sp. XY044 TaxID=2026089 RepID=UPI000B987BE9|nr:AraC family transcriptional regulator [Paenibacillus sp. XY044]OZB98679.1 hypothetical protein CJP46_05945 [Paenibacillus sp. XY044]
MNPIRKQFDAQPEFPFSLNYRDRKTAQLELPHHLHDWHELVYVHSGIGSFFIDRTIYEMRRGDLFIIPGSTIHKAFPDKDDPVTSTAVFFSPDLVRQSSLGESFSYLHCFDSSSLNRAYKLECPAALETQLEDKLAAMHSELTLQTSGFRHSIVLSIQYLLLLIHRGQNAGVNHYHGPFAGPNWMRQILLYIDDHYCEQIGLRSLSRLASVSSAHFSRVFKQLTGMSVTEYITAKRVIRAKELLLRTGDSVSSIALACGFDSMPHFHRKFKQIVGHTPSHYRHNSTTR